MSRLLWWNRISNTALDDDLVAPPTPQIYIDLRVFNSSISTPLITLPRESMAGVYKLTAALRGHEDDVSSSELMK